MSGQGSITDRTMASAGWVLGRRASSTVIRLVAVAILARHLSPAEFGVVALAQVALQFIALVGEAGIGTYVVYDGEDGREARVHAAFWLNVVVSLTQCSLCLALIPVVGHIFPVGQIRSVLALLVLAFFVDQLATVPEALLLRDLRHGVLAKRDLVIDLGSAAVSVVLAVGGLGVWSLVIPTLLAEPARLLVALLGARWRPRLPLGVSHWRRILRYTAPLMGSNVLIPVTNDGDTLLVGRLLGAGPLGIYNMAWQLANLVGRNVTAVVSSVTLPALALVRGEGERLQAGYLRMVRFLGLVCFPLLAGMAVVAGDLIPVVYGPGWQPAVALLRLFIAFTLVRSVTSPSSMIYSLVGRPGIGFRIVLWLTPVYLAAIAAGCRWGAAGIATGVVLARTGAALIELHLAVRQISLSVRAVALALSASTALTLVMSGAVFVARSAMERGGVPVTWRLLLSAALGAVVYLAGLIVFRPPGSDDLFGWLGRVPSVLSRRGRAEPAPAALRGPA